MQCLQGYFCTGTAPNLSQAAVGKIRPGDRCQANPPTAHSQGVRRQKNPQRLAASKIFSNHQLKPYSSRLRLGQWMKAGTRNQKLTTLSSNFRFLLPGSAQCLTNHRFVVIFFALMGLSWRSKTGSFCALRRANSFLFSRSLALFRLFSIFLESSVYFPRQPGRFSNLFRAFCAGVLHRSTTVGYHNSRLVSRARMQE
jgi:hypothetical protein